MKGRQTALKAYAINRPPVLAHPNEPSTVRGLSDGFRCEMAGDLAHARRLRGFGPGRAVLFRYGHPGPRRAVRQVILPALLIGTQRRVTDDHRPDWIRGHLPDRTRPRLDRRVAGGGGAVRPRFLGRAAPGGLSLPGRVLALAGA